MRCLSLLSLLCFISSCNCSTLVAVNSRLKAYDDQLPNYILSGFVIGQKNAKTVGLCSQICSNTPTCKSFNYYQSTSFCELSNSDRVWDPQGMQTSSTGNYYGMKDDTTPECEEGGATVSIQDDVTPGVCGINLKRQDCIWLEWGEWGDWHFYDSLNDIRYRFRTTKGPFHGGNECEPLLSREKQFRDEKFWVGSLMTWSAASDYCNTLGDYGGHLADPTTVSGMRGLNKYGWSDYWIGWACNIAGASCLSVYKNDPHDPTQATLSASSEIWHSGEPNNYGGSEFCAHAWAHGASANDIWCTYSFPFICEFN